MSTYLNEATKELIYKRTSLQQQVEMVKTELDKVTNLLF